MTEKTKVQASVLCVRGFLAAVMLAPFPIHAKEQAPTTHGGPTKEALVWNSPNPAVSVTETKRFGSKCFEIKLGEVQGFVVTPLQAAANGSKPWV